LSDPKKKEIYDRFGLRGLQEGGTGHEGDQFGFPGDFFSDLFGGGGGGGPGPGGMFFGGGGMGGGHSHRQRKSEDSVKPLRYAFLFLIWAFCNNKEC
jgi:DnaJ family protein A protein 2